MPFVPGVSGNPDGRPTGSRNVKLNDVLGKLKEAGYDPIESLIRLAQDENEDRKLRFYADKELLMRISPILKSVEYKVDDEAKEQIEEIKQKIKQIQEENRQDH